MDVVDEMLRKGMLLSPEAAAVLRRKPELVSTLSVSGTVVTLGDVERPSVVWSAPQKNASSVSELAEFYAARFAFYRGLLEAKADRALLVSMSQAAGHGSRASIIGIVREVGQGFAVLEDGTKTLRVRTQEKLLEDECVLVTGTMDRDALVAETILFPDVPIGHAAKTSAKEARLVVCVDPVAANATVLITNASADSSRMNFAAGNSVVWPDGADGTRPVSPCLLNINGLFVLFHRISAADLQRIADAPVDKAAIRLLRSRHIDPRNTLPGDPLLLRDVPDIVVLDTGVAFSANYKGVTVVSPSRERAYEIDLRTREVKEFKAQA
ncbi:MAG: hypothetical protein HYS81_04345 [Candidatus Aenigmatarchaeota archaeon]|nr:MAG: hypothetical protein HYS81_04345 [Candidatus Aenigmarchaeota archaeon]